MADKRFVLMVVYNAIQYDARVIRAAESLKGINEKVNVISCNSDCNYKNEYFKSIVFRSRLKGASLLFSFWIYVLFYSIIHKKEIKLLYTHDYYMVYPGKVISKLLKVKWVYDAHELLIAHRGVKNDKRKLLFACLEKRSIINADLVITANFERERILRLLYKLKNTISILNIAPLFVYSNTEEKAEDVILYQGNMSEERKVSDFILILKDLPKNIKLKLIGDGPDIWAYKKLVKDLSLLDRVYFTGKIPYSQLMNESKNCKVGIVFYNMKGLNNYYCSPNKIFEYAQYGIPMLVSPQPFLKNIVYKYHIGEVLDINSPIEKKIELVLKIINNFSYYQKGMSCFLSDYTFEKEKKKLQDSILKIIQS